MSSADRLARRPGRPRSTQVDEAILHAALECLRAHGYARMSIEGVAAEAGVGKGAIYRRYTNKADLAAAALVAVRDVGAVSPSGDARADLRELVGRLRKAIDAGGMPMVGALLTEARHNPVLMCRFRERVIGPGRAEGRALLTRASEAGELEPDADIELALDLLGGAYLARRLAGGPVPREWARRLADAVWRSVAARP